ncbi:MAG: hypothetical protein PHG14_16350 [Desulfobacter postgatei]|uniref:hypothetical protein n=1 Tax=Desulfobacter postgatei TaxID=2293 RepID=UPI0023EFDC0A|nr:hypothetical protein [Desulfobacter postgatei]MDD4275283.1 hypothetical protein [Desulfobacter postgatei]
MIEGDFGAGKTRFLKLLRPKKRHAIWVDSLFNIHETLASILRELNYDTPATYRRTPVPENDLRFVQLLHYY